MGLTWIDGYCGERRTGLARTWRLGVLDWLDQRLARLVGWYANDRGILIYWWSVFSDLFEGRIRLCDTTFEAVHVAYRCLT